MTVQEPNLPAALGTWTRQAIPPSRPHPGQAVMAHVSIEVPSRIMESQEGALVFFPRTTKRFSCGPLTQANSSTEESQAPRGLWIQPISAQMLPVGLLEEGPMSLQHGGAQ